MDMQLLLQINFIAKFKAKAERSNFQINEFQSEQSANVSA